MVALKDELALRKEKCFLCNWIFRDLEKNEVLTKYPISVVDGSSQFPVEGKVKHLFLEGLWMPDLAIAPAEVVKQAKTDLNL